MDDEDEDEDEMTECPWCDARFQIIIDAASPACRPLSMGGYREGFFCPCCGYEFEDGSVE